MRAWSIGPMIERSAAACQAPRWLLSRRNPDAAQPRAGCRRPYGGQGCGGGALARLPARRVLAAQHAWLSPLPPEGASVIIHGDTAHAEEMANRQQIRAMDLATIGTVHRIVSEQDGADAKSLARSVAAEAAALLIEMRSQP